MELFFPGTEWNFFSIVYFRSLFFHIFLIIWKQPMPVCKSLFKKKYLHSPFSLYVSKHFRREYLKNGTFVVLTFLCSKLTVWSMWKNFWFCYGDTFFVHIWSTVFNKLYVYFPKNSSLVQWNSIILPRINLSVTCQVYFSGFSTSMRIIWKHTDWEQYLE